jgi:ATP-dependent helicase/nuclease subunit A
MAVAIRQVAPHAVLKGEQRLASDPAEHVWLSASAGTGKTYVLSARVLRLLLRGVAPDAILCLTFTKAGAAEMAERVHERLAHWVRLKAPELAGELKALDEDFGPEAVAVARTLFAKVLEARGGGLRIMTIHAFCQTLLGGFPMEAGIAPGFRPLEGREEAVLQQNVLAEMVVDAERGGDLPLLADLQALSMRLGEGEVIRYLTRSAHALDALNELSERIEPVVRREMRVPLDYSADDIAAACENDAFDRATLMQLVAVLNDWGTTRALERIDIISNWLLGTAAQRAAELPKLARAWRKADGDVFASKGYVPNDSRYMPLVERIDAWAGDLLDQMSRAELATAIAAALRAALAYARAYAEAKRTRGLVDFNDQISLTRKLLAEPGMGDWIRFKLDQTTDHILVDESQDTNRAQWDIIDALADEFWAGAGAKPDALRTLFAVGDYKQAIYGFQGTDPQHYERAGLSFELKAVRAEREFQRLSLNQSFRSTPPVLDIVDAVIANVGHEAMGLNEGAPRHGSSRSDLPGQVLLFPPVNAEIGEDEAGEEDWLGESPRVLADRLARQIKGWLNEPLRLAKNKGRPLKPGDIMILVRKRGELASLLVARLHQQGVPVAGVDRLRLQAPIAVQDLLATMRFAAQPLDDLNLANLLVSPLLGWSQEDLFAVAHDRPGRLWNVIPDGATRETLLTLLSAADNITSYAFLENILSGPMKGRHKLLSRLGEEARDPIDELLNAALLFEREGTASLQVFLDWFDRGETEVVRDAGAAGDAVRVMTVHGAKGLQAPLVILADACADPDQARETSFKWTIEGVVDDLPSLKPRKAEQALVASLQSAVEDAETKAKREHWRLLYVAMTRAEEILVVAGALGPRAKGVVPADSWHSALEQAMMVMGADRTDDMNWGSVLCYGTPAVLTPSKRGLRDDRLSTGSGLRDVELPNWLNQPAPQESRPPRPLAPSSIGKDDTANPPPSNAMAAAAQRGRLLHALFERLPPLPTESRRAAGEAWLKSEGADPALVNLALGVIDHPAFADVFAPDALAEAPVVGVVDGVVIAGTVDRLSVGETAVDIIDFKTGRRVPASPADCPPQHLRQMAAYGAVLQGIFPDHEIRAALLYSEGPILLRLPPELLALHKPSFAAAQDNLVTAG